MPEIAIFVHADGLAGGDSTVAGSTNTANG